MQKFILRPLHKDLFDCYALSKFFSKIECSRGLILLLALFLYSISSSLAKDREAEFNAWVNDTLRTFSLQKGIKESTFNTALKNVRLLSDLPDLGTTSRPQKQAEFLAPARYFDEKNITSLVKQGKAYAIQHKELLAKIEQRYGVPAPIILAIWGRETAFGTHQGTHPAFDVLATKAFLSQRKDLFLKEIVDALTLIETGEMRGDQMRASWAGAMGHPQFLPSSIRQYAVDFDGDGTRDIWNSIPDALASIANYLKHYGWQKNLSFGREIMLPATLSCTLEGEDMGKTMQNWRDLGIKTDPAADTSGLYFLVNPAGRLGPSFLVSQNFYVLKKYNMSDLYALFIGHVADRIANSAPPFKTPWAKVDRMDRSNIANMQIILNSKGLDVGKMDGLVGFKTRRTIGEWQIKMGQKPTCFPSKKLGREIK